MAELPELRSRDEIQAYLWGTAEERGVSLGSPEVAEELDRRDKLATFRKKFAVPTIGQLLDEEERDETVDVSEDSIYLCGNSLGLQPSNAQTEVDREMAKWREKGLRGHFVGAVPWYSVEDFVASESARIVGCKPREVTAMNSLTVNIHFALASFYQPTKERHKILMEERCFPSDFFAVRSQIRWHGYDPESALIRVPSRNGELLWKTEDIVKVIEEEGDTIALVYFSGIHYATGHLFDMEAITKAAHNKGIYAGFDLAHAAGNVELCLHDWEVDFALWCSYKYLNSGPGGVSGFYVHEKHGNNPDLPRLQGWWSHSRDSRMEMKDEFEFLPGAVGFHVSNPPVFQLMLLKASLDVFAETSMEDLCRKSRLLTGYLEMLVEKNLGKDAVTARNGSSGVTGAEKYVTIVTSQDPAERGCQLSLQFSWSVEELHKRLGRKGLVCDLRQPFIMRVAPVPLYNSFKDVLRFYKLLEDSMPQ